MKYRSKIVEIEAVRFLGSYSIDEMFKEWDTFFQLCEISYNPILNLKIITPEGTMQANIGDYIIKGTAGEFYPCKASIFEYKYEPC